MSEARASIGRMLIRVAIKGESPLLCHRFTDAAAMDLEAGTSTTIRARVKPSPREQAEDFLYRDSSGAPVIPGPNIFRAIIDAGKFTKNGRFPLTTAKGSLIPAGIVVPDFECAIVTEGKPATWEVDSRSIVNPSTGGRAMCHRPRFDAWEIAFDLVVDDKMFNEQLVRRLIDDAGSKIGLGAFRPSRKGPFGRFKVILWEVTKAISFVDAPSPSTSVVAS